MNNIFDLLSIDEKKVIKVISLKKDEILFHENDVCNEIGIVLKGVISISSYSYQGIEMNYNTIMEGGIFGNNLLFSSEPIHKGNVIAKLPSEVALISKPQLLNLLKNNESFLKEYLKIQSDFGKKLNQKIKILSFHHAEDRLLYLLQANNGVLKYRSVSSLASSLNLSREATSRLISALIKEKVIRKELTTLYLVDK